MKSVTEKSGFTLIEMLMVVAIIAILVVMVVGLTKRIDDQGKERLCRDTLVLIDNALEQFRDFGYVYKHQDFAGLVFPLDCNDMSITSITPELNLRNTMSKAIYPTAAISILGGTYDTGFSGSAAMYFILNQVPGCRATIDKIDKSLLTDAGLNGEQITITMNFGATSQTVPFIRINDPWQKPLRYDYYPDFKDYVGTWSKYMTDRDSAKLTFPIVTSAGPDGRFDTADDIINRKPE